MLYLIAFVIANDVILVDRDCRTKPYEVCAKECRKCVFVTKDNIPKLISELKLRNCSKAAVCGKDNIPGNFMINDEGEIKCYGDDDDEIKHVFCYANYKDKPENPENNKPPCHKHDNHPKSSSSSCSQLCKPSSCHHHDDHHPKSSSSSCSQLCKPFSPCCSSNKSSVIPSSCLSSLSKLFSSCCKSSTPCGKNTCCSSTSCSNFCKSSPCCGSQGPSPYPTSNLSTLIKLFKLSPCLKPCLSSSSSKFGSCCSSCLKPTFCPSSCFSSLAKFCGSSSCCSYCSSCLKKPYPYGIYPCYYRKSRHNRRGLRHPVFKFRKCCVDHHGKITKRIVGFVSCDKPKHSYYD